jgi:NADH-quinone oxidoreductase subunit M
MILIWLIAILFVAGILAGIAARWDALLSRCIALTAIGVDLVLVAGLWSTAAPGAQHTWIAEADSNWVPSLGVHFHLAVDGLSLLMLMLTFFLGIVATLASWTEIRGRVGFFHFNLLWVLTGIAGVFMAVDLFLFYFSWELMLIPMYFLILIWGHERRVYAATKFFLFTQLSGLLMLIAILALYFIHHQATGVYTFEYSELLGTRMSSGVELWLMLGFFVAFAVKLPAVPLHTWLPDAHTEAPTAGSVILAGLLLKTGAYGLIRFVIPLFPRAAHEFTPVALALGATGIVYGAVMAYSQTDFKRLVAYTSVSHLGFVLVGVFSWNPLALQGAIMTMVCHGLSTGGLFVLVGGLQERIHTRDLERMGGLWAVAPRLSGAVLFFSMASLGLPGIGDFVGEFLVLLGSYKVSVAITVVASLGVLASTFYALRMIQRAFHGPNTRAWRLSDLTAREGVMVGTMIVGLLWLGLSPQAVLNTFEPALQNLQREVQASRAQASRNVGEMSNAH